MLEQPFAETIEDAVARCNRMAEALSECLVTIYDARLVADTAFVEDVTPAPLIARMMEGGASALRLCEEVVAQVG